MMKILATGDWHLGNCFHGFDRMEEHAHYLDWLLDCVQREEADVLLIAGDVFDSSNPSAAAQELYYSFLNRLNERFPALQTVIIAGNHDSAARLEAPREMLERHRVYVRGVVRRLPEGEVDWDNLLVPVTGGKVAQERAWIVAVPYLRDGDFVRGMSYAEGVSDFLNRALQAAGRKKRPDEAVLLMAHLYATGAEIAEGSSERVVIGGAERVDMSRVECEVGAVVLGHLHRRQKLGNRSNWFYPGSALPMSFTERTYRHGAVSLTFSGGELAGEPCFHEYTLLHPLRSLPEKPALLPEVIEVLSKLPDAGEEGVEAHMPYLEVNVLLDTPVQGINKQIEEALDGKGVRLCRTAIFYRTQLENETGEVLESVDDLLTKNPLEVIRKSYLSRHKCEMREELVALANRAIEAARKEDEE